MLTLTVRTDKPEAEIGLFDGDTKLAYSVWTAHRQLAETIHTKIKELLESQERTLEDLGGIVAFKGPGSFTGLRIGLSAANALAYGLQIPIVGEQGDEDDDWIKKGLQRIGKAGKDQVIVPEYGAPPHITPPQK